MSETTQTTDVVRREPRARRIWWGRFGDMRGFPTDGPSWAHDEADREADHG